MDPSIAIRGTHAIAVSVRDLEEPVRFLELAWGARRVAEEGAAVRYAVGNGGSGTLVDLVLEPDKKPGSQDLAEGFIHHGAFQLPSVEDQEDLKKHLESTGFEDVSEVYDRGYFFSIYVRVPGGPLFEAAVTHPEGFAVDEPADQLGNEIKIAPQFKQDRESLLARLETIEYERA